MPKYSNRSAIKLAECDERIQRVFNEVIKTVDCTLLVGHRNQEDQETMKETGRSQLQWPDSSHNKLPSLAIDAIGYPIDWNDRERITLFAGFVLGTAKQMGIDLIWGGDWNVNWQTADNSFDDLVHFQLVED
jgi:peptidoglycan L-alanyl-D-glutamate endopeptidase CwlK